MLLEGLQLYLNIAFLSNQLVLWTAFWTLAKMILTCHGLIPSPVPAISAPWVLPESLHYAASMLLSAASPPGKNKFQHHVSVFKQDRKQSKRSWYFVKFAITMTLATAWQQQVGCLHRNSKLDSVSTTRHPLAAKTLPGGLFFCMQVLLAVV